MASSQPGAGGDASHAVDSRLMNQIIDQEDDDIDEQLRAEQEAQLAVKFEEGANHSAHTGYLAASTHAGTKSTATSKFRVDAASNKNAPDPMTFLNDDASSAHPARGGARLPTT